MAEDAGADCLISVEDDGVGMDPDGAAGARRPSERRQHVGLGNVDERLRSVFGDEFGLVVETAPGAGTKVSMRVPKFHACARHDAREAAASSDEPGRPTGVDRERG